METPLQELMQALPESADKASGADSLGSLADGFKALADTTRLHMIHLLMTCGEMCACEFMPALDLTQSNASFHLKTLKHAGFIKSRKEGKWMFYSLHRRVFERFRAGFENAFDLEKWPEKTESVSCEGTACGSTKCRQQ